MSQINNTTIKEEITALCLQYEKALVSNNIEILDHFFWNSPEVVRFGARENLYGIEQLRAFRQSRSPKNLEREMFNLKVVTFGTDTAVATLEFRRTIGGAEQLGRQSQTWYKFPQIGWKIVSAHVSQLSS